MPSPNNHIDYVEFYANDLTAIKKFYSECFDWKFTDYGDSYVAFESSGISGGFEYTDKPTVNGALIVIYHRDLEATLD